VEGDGGLEADEATADLPKIGLEVDGAAAADAGRAIDEAEENADAGAVESDGIVDLAAAEKGLTFDAGFALVRVSTGEFELLAGASMDFAGGIDCGLWGRGALCRKSMTSCANGGSGHDETLGADRFQPFVGISDFIPTKTLLAHAAPVRKCVKLVGGERKAR
jgi:hypothetical protein